MKRYLITNPNFNGAAELIYTEAGILQKIDVSNTSMGISLINFFKKAAPVDESGLASSFGKETVIVPAEFEVTFDMFWAEYDNKINRKRCLPVWDKLNKAQQVKAFYGVKKYNRHLRDTGFNKLNPENYLKNETWENEYK